MMRRPGCLSVRVIVHGSVSVSPLCPAVALSALGPDRDIAPPAGRPSVSSHLATLASSSSLSETECESLSAVGDGVAKKPSGSSIPAYIPRLLPLSSPEGLASACHIIHFIGQSRTSKRCLVSLSLKTLAEVFSWRAFATQGARCHYRSNYDMTQCRRAHGYPSSFLQHATVDPHNERRRGGRGRTRARNGASMKQGAATPPTEPARPSNRSGVALPRKAPSTGSGEVDACWRPAVPSNGTVTALLLVALIHTEAPARGTSALLGCFSRQQRRPRRPHPSNLGPRVRMMAP